MKADSVMGSVFSFKISTFTVKFVIMSMKNINFLATGAFQRQQANRIAACFNIPKEEIKKSEDTELPKDSEKEEDEDDEEKDEYDEDGNGKDEIEVSNKKKEQPHPEFKKSMTPHEHQQLMKARMTSCFNVVENDLIKGGEGSKGGKVIGHTASGKPVYQKNKVENATHHYATFSAQDHKDAEKIHGDSGDHIRAKQHQKAAQMEEHHDSLKVGDTVYSNYHKKKVKIVDKDEKGSGPGRHLGHVIEHEDGKREGINSGWLKKKK